MNKDIKQIFISFAFFALACGMLFISYYALSKVNLTKYKVINKRNDKIIQDVLEKIKKDKISQNYFGYLFTNQIAYSCVTQLILTIFVIALGFTDVQASNLNLLLCIISAFLGTIILKKFTLKNNYINFAIKYIGRCLFYLLAFLTNSKLFFLLAIIYTLILSDSYVNVTDAPYINRFNKKEQLAFCNFMEMFSYIAISLGTFICAISLKLGFRYNFLVATIFIILATMFGFIAIRLHNIERNVKNDR